MNLILGLDFKYRLTDLIVIIILKVVRKQRAMTRFTQTVSAASF